jgi:hypothetical protein
MHPDQLTIRKPAHALITSSNSSFPTPLVHTGHSNGMQIPYGVKSSHSSSSTPLVHTGHGNGMQIPYEIKTDQWGGLGVFTTTHIKAGTRVWDFSKANIKLIPHEESKALCHKLKNTDMEALMDVHTSNYFITEKADMVDIRCAH